MIVFCEKRESRSDTRDETSYRKLFSGHYKITTLSASIDHSKASVAREPQ